MEYDTNGCLELVSYLILESLEKTDDPELREIKKMFSIKGKELDAIDIFCRCSDKYGGSDTLIRNKIINNLYEKSM